MEQTIYPGESASNLASGSHIPGRVIGLAPPATLDWDSMAGFLSALEGEDKAMFVKSVVEHCVPRYYDAYATYCRVAAGSPMMSSVSAPDANSLGGQAVACLKQVVPTSSSCSSESSGTSSDRSFNSHSSNRARQWASSRISKLRYPLGLCYSHAFKPYARETVASTLAFWPKFSAMLSQPVETAFPLAATESFILIDGAEGYHLTSRSDPVIASTHPSRIWSYNDAVVGLSRRHKFDYGSYGHFLASSKGWFTLDQDAYTLLSPDDTLGGSVSPVRVRGVDQSSIPLVYQSYVRRLLGSVNGVVGSRLVPKVVRKLPAVLPAGYVLVVENRTAEFQIRRKVTGPIVILSEFLASPTPFACVWTRSVSESWVTQLCNFPGLLESLQSLVYYTDRPNGDRSLLKVIIDYCNYAALGKEPFAKGKSYVDMLSPSVLYAGISVLGNEPSVRQLLDTPYTKFKSVDSMSNLKVHSNGDGKLFITPFGVGVSLSLFLLAYLVANQCRVNSDTLASELFSNFRVTDTLIQHVTESDSVLAMCLLDESDQVCIF